MFEGVDLQAVQDAWAAYQAGVISAPRLKELTELAGASIEVSVSEGFEDPNILAMTRASGGDEVEGIMLNLEKDYIEKGHRTHLWQIKLDEKLWWELTIFKKPESAE